MTHNDSGRYDDRWVWLDVACDQCAFLRPGERLRLPVAHAEGKVVTDGAATLSDLRSRRLIALRYCDAEGRSGGFPANPNGSVDDIAGLTDETGRILGLMPHPERAIDRTHLADWTRSREASPSGLGLFERAVRYMESG